MAAMRACATANTLAVLSVVFAATFSACASGSPDASSPGTTDGTSKTQEGSGSAAAPGDTSAATQAQTGAPAEQQKPKKTPETVADCKELLTEITNEPKGGVVMNNAQPATDAGASDRFQPMVELMKEKRDGFRCCFDLWAKNNPGASGKVAFQFELAPDGTLKSAKVKPDETDIKAPEVESCMVELAQSMTYPKSPSGKLTTYTHRFEFKARR
jgi:hypothetical protein